LVEPDGGFGFGRGRDQKGAFNIKVTRLGSAKDTTDKFSAIQGAHDQPPAVFSPPAAANASRTVTAKDRICDIFRFDTPLRQVFDIGAIKEQTPRQHLLHTIMVCSQARFSTSALGRRGPKSEKARVKRPFIGGSYGLLEGEEIAQSESI
jgi:hypothetical protein